jgi:hypothetical protein
VWKVLEADDNNNFAVAVPLCVRSSFRSAPQTCKANEHALVMFRPGLLRTYPSTGHVYNNNYTIIPLTRGPKWITDPELYNAPIAAVFRVTALLEAELGLFQLLLGSWMSTLTELPLQSYTIVPTPIGYKTTRYVLGAKGKWRNWIREVAFMVVVHGGEHLEERVAIVRKALQLDGGALSKPKMIGCFHTIVVPNLRVIKDCPAMDPLSNVFDYMGQITITGLRRDLTILEIMVKFVGSGIINPRGITGICISRGNGKAVPFNGEILTEDVLHLMGTNLIRVNINPAAFTFSEVALSSVSLRTNLKVGNDYRDSKRQEHGAALSAWNAKPAVKGSVLSQTTMAHTQGNMVVRVESSDISNQQVELFQRTMSEVALMREELRASNELNKALQAAAVLRELARDEAAAARDEANETAKALRREEKIKIRQEKAAKQVADALLLREEAAADKAEGLRLAGEVKAAEDARHERERSEDLEREEEGRRRAEQRRAREAASSKEDAMRAMAEREDCEQAKHEKERKEDLERERETI